MRIFIVLSLLGLSFVTLSQAFAQEPGSIGTVECREVQLQIQNTVDMEDHYKNHGQLVKTVVHALKSAKKAKLITGKCASCIFTQFALRISIADQDACGPDIETEACYFSDGGCEDLTAENCIEIEGKPQGIGTDCTSVSSDTIETVACCLIGDDCEDMTPEDCDVERGMPKPSGSNCANVDCASSY
jgi:hypothetical protein